MTQMTPPGGAHDESKCESGRAECSGIHEREIKQHQANVTLMGQMFRTKQRIEWNRMKSDSATNASFFAANKNGDSASRLSHEHTDIKNFVNNF